MIGKEGPTNDTTLFLSVFHFNHLFFHNTSLCELCLDHVQVFFARNETCKPHHLVLKFGTFSDVILDETHLAANGPKFFIASIEICSLRLLFEFLPFQSICFF